jgi:hypothetical protein
MQVPLKGLQEALLSLYYNINTSTTSTTIKQGLQELWESKEESFKDPQNVDVEETST